MGTQNKLQKQSLSLNLNNPFLAKLFKSFIEQVEKVPSSDFASYGDYACFLLDWEEMEFILEVLNTYIESCQSYIEELTDRQKNGETIEADEVAIFSQSCDDADLGEVLRRRIQKALESIGEAYGPVNFHVQGGTD